MDAAESTGAAEQPADSIASAPPPRPALGQLDATLDHLARLCSRLENAELRFKQLTDECQGVLQGLVAVDRRHSSVVASLNERLGEWCNLEGKLLEESARRIEQFERGVGHEWMVIRQLHEEPIAELKDQADQLRLTCLEAARLARFRLDSAEQAYTTYAADLERRMAEWSRELLKAARTRAVTDGAGPDGLPATGTTLTSSSSPVEPWPLEGVAQLHQELRTGGQATTPASSPEPRRGDRASLPRPPASELAQSTRRQSDADVPPEPRRGLLTRPAFLTTAAAVIVLSLGLYAVRPRSPAPNLSRAAVAPPVRAGTSPASADASVAGGDERLVEAQRTAERAGAMVEILAAPDLRRYALAGVSTSPTPQPYGQVLWSRSRGLAASASRLPTLPAGKMYQLWVVPDGPAVAAGVLVPDPAGRASLVLPGPLKLPLPVTLRVTIEDRGQATSPRGPVCLTRVPIT